MDMGAVEAQAASTRIWSGTLNIVHVISEILGALTEVTSRFSKPSLKATPNLRHFS